MEKKELTTRFNEVKMRVSDPKQMVGNVLAEKVCRKWTEDFVDESTGEVVSIERSEVVLDKKGCRLTDEVVASIMFYIQSGDIKDVLVTNQERSGWCDQDYDTFEVYVVDKARTKHRVLVHALSFAMAIQIAIDYLEQMIDGRFTLCSVKKSACGTILNFVSKADGASEGLRYLVVVITHWDEFEGKWIDSNFFVQAKDADIAIDILRAWIAKDEGREKRYKEYRVKTSTESPITDIVPLEFCKKYIETKAVEDYILNGESFGQRPA